MLGSLAQLLNLGSVGGGAAATALLNLASISEVGRSLVHCPQMLESITAAISAEDVAAAVHSAGALCSRVDSVVLE